MSVLRFVPQAAVDAGAADCSQRITKPLSLLPPVSTYRDDYCEDLDGDMASSEAESESSGVSISSLKPPKRKRQSTPSINPFTGEKRGRGRPRKFPIGSQQSAGKVTGKRKRGRPRKIVSVPTNVAQNAAGVGVQVQKRKPGRPRKVPSVVSEGSGQGPTYASPASATAAGVSTTDAQSAVAAGMPSTTGTAASEHGLRLGHSSSFGSTAAAAHAVGVTSVAPPAKRGRGRPRKNPPPSPKSPLSGPEFSATSNASHAGGHANAGSHHPRLEGEAQQKRVATDGDESVGQSSPLAGQEEGQKVPNKRGRGRIARKSNPSPPSPALNDGES